MKLSSIAILLGAAVAAAPSVVSAEVSSSCLMSDGLVGGYVQSAEALVSVLYLLPYLLICLFG